MKAPCVITTSGMTTADKAAIGAYCKPRCAHGGKAHSVSEIKKNERATTVTTVIKAMVSKVLAWLSANSP